MKLSKIFWCALLISSILLVGCGGGDSAENSVFLPKEFADIGAKRVTEPQTFVGESLYEYIDGGAELYHLYNFVDVVTASYDMDGVEIVVDIYQFDTPENAYGLYTLMRPETPYPIKLGVEGFASEPNVDFVKGKYMVRLIGFEIDQMVAHSIQELSLEIVTLIPGTTAYPPVFSKFPAENKIAYTDKIQADSYMGYGFMSMVVTQDYSLGNDTATLFMTDDANGEKFLQFKEMAVIDEGVLKALEDLPFDEGQAVIIATSYYGEVLAGLINGKLYGVVNYSDTYKDMVKNWLASQ